MQAIISEAQALRDGWRDFALALGETLAKREQPWGVTLAELGVLVERNALPATPALAAERNHFAKQAKRNEKNAKSMALKRSEANGEGTGDGKG